MSLLRDNNQDPDVLFLRGQLFYLQGENEQAIKHFKGALSLDPDSSKTVKYLRMVQRLLRTKDEGNAAFKAKRYQEAIDKMTNDCRRAGKSQHYIHRGCPCIQLVVVGCNTY